VSALANKNIAKKLVSTAALAEQMIVELDALQRTV